MGEYQRSGSGCLKAFLIVVLLVIILVAGGVYYAARNLPDIVRKGSAAVLENMAQSLVEEMKYSPEQKQAILGPIKQFSEDIRSGKVSLEEAKAVGEQFLQGGAMAAVALEGFRHAFLEQSTLSPDEKEQGRINLSRFIAGASEGRIPPEKTKELLDIVKDQSDGTGESKKIKEQLTDEEVRRFLQTAGRAADDAGMERRAYPVDLGREISEAMEQGKAKAREDLSGR